MTFADWTAGGQIGYEFVLDGIIKYAGISSARGRASIGGYFSTLTHNTFSQTRAQILLWVYSNDATTTGAVYHASYGGLSCTNSVITTWERFRVSFWYDILTNTKWGRVERWNGAAWVQLGGGDTNFGAGAAAAGGIYLRADSGAAVKYVHFDELEVYS